MQAAATRPRAVPKQRRADNRGAKPHIATADDTGLLDALPIAAAIIERQTDRCLKVAAYNRRFHETVRQSTCTALDWNEADCLKSGAIAELLQEFFDGNDVSGELDFKDGEGVSQHYFRLKLAPVPKKNADAPRCLLSVVDRTVEVQSERTLRA